MKHSILFLAMPLIIAGCAGGPVKDYYNPAIVGKKFPGPVTMALVDDAKTESERLVREGYTIVGTSAYNGKLAEAKELKAQAHGLERIMSSIAPSMSQPRREPGTFAWEVGVLVGIR